MSRSTAVYIASRPFVPIIGGREKMIEQSLRFLKKSGSTTHLVVFHGAAENPVALRQSLSQYADSVTPVRLASLAELSWNILLRSRKLSAQEMLYQTRTGKKKIESLLRAVRPDVVIFDMVRTAQYVRFATDSRVVIDLDDLLSARYRAFLSRGETHSLSGTFSGRLPRGIQRLVSVFAKPLLKREQRILAKRELEYAQRADSVMLTSPLEAVLLGQLSGQQSVYANPPAVRIPNLTWQRPPVLGNQCDALFLGNMSTSQNKESFRLLCFKYAPLVAAAGVHLHLHIVGRGNTRELSDLANGFEFTHHGYVEDLSVIANICHLALLPIASGTGVKTKVLDALALGMPVLTNEKGVEGLSLLKNGRDAVIEENEDQFAAAVRRILFDEEHGAQLGRAALRYVATHHSPTMLTTRYLQAVWGRAIPSARAWAVGQAASEWIDVDEGRLHTSANQLVEIPVTVVEK